MANKGAKIMAILGLTGILASIIGTGILFIIGDNAKEEVVKTKNFDINKFVKENNLELTETGKTIEIKEKTSSGETNSGTLGEKTNSGKIE